MTGNIVESNDFVKHSTISVYTSEFSGISSRQTETVYE